MRMLFLLLILPFICFGQDLEDGLLLHYTFDNTVEDASSNNYDGTPSDLSFTEDRLGNPQGAALFNGESSFIDLPNVESLKPEFPVSFAFWVRYDSDNVEDRALFNTSFEEDVSSGIYFTSGVANGNFGIGFGDGSNFYNASSRRGFGSNATVQTGEWVHIVVVLNGTLDMKIYVNCEDPGGAYSGSGGSLFYSSLPGSIGRQDQNTQGVLAYYFEGALDDFRYYNRALTEAEALLLCTTPDDLAINLSSTTSPLCSEAQDGSIIVEGEGGIPPYEYSLNTNDHQESNVFDGLSAGDYNVYVKDNQANVASISVNLENVAEFNIGLVANNNAACDDVSSGSLEVIASDSDGSSIGFTYSINSLDFQSSGLFEFLAPGIYTVIAQNSDGCLQNINVAIELFDGPQLITNSNLPSCVDTFDGSIEVVNNSNMAGVVFSLDGVLNTDGVFTDLPNGEYEITATDSNGCETMVSVVLDTDILCEDEVLCPLLQNRLGMQINKWEDDRYSLKFYYQDQIDVLESCEYSQLFEMIYFHLVNKTSNVITSQEKFELYCNDMDRLSDGDFTPLVERLDGMNPDYNVLTDIELIRAFILNISNSECVKI